MHLQNLHLFCQDDGKPEGLLQRRRMCFYFFCSFQTLTGGSSISVHQGGSTDLIAPKDSSQAGESLKMSNAASPQRTVRPSVRPSMQKGSASPPTQQLEVSFQSQNTCSKHSRLSSLCTDPIHLIIHAFSQDGDKETVKTHRNSKKKEKKANEALIERCF